MSIFYINTLFAITVLFWCFPHVLLCYLYIAFYNLCMILFLRYNFTLGELRHEVFVDFKLTLATPSSPVFRSEHLCVLQAIQVQIGSLRILANVDTLRQLILFAACLEDPAKPDAVHQNSCLEPTEVTESGEDSINQLREDSRNGLVNYTVNGVFRSLEIIVAQGPRSIASVSFGAMKATVRKLPFLLDGEVILSSTSVRDCTPEVKDSRYPGVLSCSSESQVFNVRVLMDSSPDKSPLAEDINICFHLSGLQFVFLNRFVQDLLHAINTLSVPTKTPLRKTPSQITGSVLEPSPLSVLKIKLHCELEASTITVPISSKAVNCLVVDLGQITVKNHFHYHATFDTVILDMVCVNLDHLQLNMINSPNVHTRENVHIRENLVNPVKININVERNLHPGHHVIPDVHVEFVVTDFTIFLYNVVVQQVLQISSSNLQERSSWIVSRMNKLHSSATSTPTRPLGVLTESCAVVVESKNESGVFWPRLSIDVRVQLFQVHLLVPSTEGESGRVSLAMFQTEGILVRINQVSDGLQAISLVIIRFLLLDKRPLNRLAFPPLFSFGPMTVLSGEVSVGPPAVELRCDFLGIYFSIFLYV